MNTICLETRKVLTNQNDFWAVFSGPMDRIEAKELSRQTKEFRKVISAEMIREFLVETRPEMVRRNKPVSGNPIRVASEFLMYHLDSYFVNIELKQVNQ